MTPKRARLVYLVVCLAMAFALPCRATLRVVDTGNPTASDENPGTEAAPWRTIAKAATEVQPGDVVCVMAGTYPERVRLSTSGTPDRPIVFRSVPRHQAVIQGFECDDASYVRIEGFKVHAPDPADRAPGIVLGSGGHVAAIGNEVAEQYMGISGGGRNCRVALNRTFKTQFGLLVGARSSSWIIERNEFRRQYQHQSGDCDYSRMWGKDHVVRFNRYHDTRRAEVGQAHLDCVQTFNVREDPDQYLQNITFERNVCSQFSQGFMLSTSLPGTVNTFIFRRNLFFEGGSWGLNVKRIPGCTSANNTFYHIKWYGFGNAGGENGRAENNIFVQINTPYTTGPGFEGANNLIHDYENAPEGSEGAEYFRGDPAFAGAGVGNFRLTDGSPAIDSGSNGGDVGAVEYPNVYYVDVDHPAADDQGFGYGGWPFKTLARGLEVAGDGETIVVRDGVYRESVDLSNPNVTVRAADGETARICTAALVTGWERKAGRWTAGVASRPENLLLDGAVLKDFEYDRAAGTVSVRGFDPRLHTVEIPDAFTVKVRDRDDPAARGIIVCDSFVPHNAGTR